MIRLGEISPLGQLLFKKNNLAGGLKFVNFLKNFIIINKKYAFLVDYLKIVGDFCKTYG
jgi:hypothetical protein